MKEITITDSALLLGMSYNLVMRLVLRGDLRSRRTGSGRFLIERQDVEGWALKATNPEGSNPGVRLDSPSIAVRTNREHQATASV
jgi:excisionase family DNA binding protein